MLGYRLMVGQRILIPSVLVRVQVPQPNHIDWICTVTKTVILWDWDNTLADTFEAIFTAQNVMRRSYNLPEWTRQEAKNAMNASGRRLISDLVGEDKADEARQIYLSAYRQNADKISLKEGAFDVLKKSKELGYINILASNKTGSVLRQEAEILNVYQFFDRILGAHDALEDKPSKFFTDKALAGFSFEKLYSIGDGKSDMKMARHYKNASAILVWTNPQSAEFKDDKPDYAFDDLTAVSDFLEKK